MEPAGARPFSSETDVTAVDFVVQITDGTGDAGPKELSKDDLSIIVDGVERPIVDLDLGAASKEGTEREPWHVILYLDAVLHGDQELRWAADLWSRSLDSLLPLGRVDLVVADPEPRWIHLGDRDPEQLAAALVRWRLEALGQGQLAKLREGFLEQDGSEDEELAPREAFLEEAGLVRHRLETLLLYLTSVESSTSHKAVFLAGSAFALDAEPFYGLEPSESSPLKTTATDVARTLAAYGWLTFPMAQPLPENRAGIKPGIRIGKLRLTLGNDLALPGFTATFEEERDAEKADALVALAEALAEEGKPEEAMAELQKALHHYYGDPRTADRQAVAYTRLGDLLQEAGEEDWASRAYEAARELTRGDPDSDKTILAPPEPGSDPQDAGLDDRPAGVIEVDPEAAFELLANSTAGAPVREAGDLQSALESLAWRQRITFQLGGPVAARLLPVELRLRRKGIQGKAPLWTRHGTPTTLAEARARAALLGDLQGKADELRAVVAQGMEEESGELVIGRDGPWEKSRRLRLTVARAGFDGLIDVSHQHLDLAEASGTLRFPFALDPEQPFLAVVLEDLVTGHWAVRLIDQD